MGGIVSFGRKALLPSTSSSTPNLHPPSAVSHLARTTPESSPLPKHAHTVCLVSQSCLVLSCLVLSCPVLSCPVLSCPVLSCPVLSCPVLSCPVLSCPVLSCPVLSCPVLSCPVLSCPVLSCPVLSCLVLSCLVLSCLVSLTLRPSACPCLASPSAPPDAVVPKCPLVHPPMRNVCWCSVIYIVFTHCCIAHRSFHSQIPKFYTDFGELVVQSTTSPSSLNNFRKNTFLFFSK